MIPLLISQFPFFLHVLCERKSSSLEASHHKNYDGLVSLFLEPPLPIGVMYVDGRIGTKLTAAYRSSPFFVFFRNSLFLFEARGRRVSLVWNSVTSGLEKIFKMIVPYSVTLYLLHSE